MSHILVDSHAGPVQDFACRQISDTKMGWGQMSTSDDSHDRKFGRNWLWFLPVCVAVLLAVERHTVPYALSLLKLGHKRWTWAALFSPSAYFCVGVMWLSVVGPLWGLALIPAVIHSDDKRRRYVYAFVIFIAILLLPLVTDALLWGSFPFTFDSRGIGRLRLIPFIPWPDSRFGQY
jgi:hypothetical protein